MFVVGVGKLREALGGSTCSQSGISRRTGGRLSSHGNMLQLSVKHLTEFCFRGFSQSPVDWGRRRDGPLPLKHGTGTQPLAFLVTEEMSP